MHAADGRRPRQARDNTTSCADHTCQSTPREKGLHWAWSAPKPEAGQVAHLGHDHAVAQALAEEVHGVVFQVLAAGQVTHLRHSHAVAQALAEHAHGLVLQVVEAGGAAQRQRIHPPLLAHFHAARILPQHTMSQTRRPCLPGVLRQTLHACWADCTDLSKWLVMVAMILSCCQSFSLRLILLCWEKSCRTQASQSVWSLQAVRHVQQARLAWPCA